MSYLTHYSPLISALCCKLSPAASALVRQYFELPKSASFIIPSLAIRQFAPIVMKIMIGIIYINNNKRIMGGYYLYLELISNIIAISIILYSIVIFITQRNATLNMIIF